MIRRIVLGFCCLCALCLVSCSREENPAITPLMKAVSTGNKARVKKLLAQGADVLVVHPITHETLLMMAIKNPNILEMLLKKDTSNINAQDDDGWTALMFGNAPEESIELLLKYGADMEIRDKEGRTALSWAASSGNIGALQQLISAHADINTQDNDLQTPLMWAALMGRKRAVELLLQAGADINIVDKNGNTVFTRINKVKIKSFPQLNTALVDEYGLTPLHLAAMHNDINLIHALIKQGMDPNIVNQKKGETPLMRAAILGSNQAIKALLKSGANIHLKDINGNTALMWAVSSDDLPKTVKLLSKNNSQIDEKNIEGLTPLMRASKRGLIKSVKVLLAKGANPNLLDNQGKSAFTWAIDGEHPEIAHILLKSGAPGSNVNMLRHTPITVITDLPETYQTKGKTLAKEQTVVEDMTPLLLAIHAENPSLVQELIQTGADVNTPDSQKITPLMWAVGYQSLEMVRMLLQAGADVNAFSPETNPPLLIASGYNNKEIVEELLKYKAKINLKNIYGTTPLFRASTLYFQINLIKDMEKDGIKTDPLPQDAAQKHAEIAKILIQHGANVNETNNENKTPLLWAVSLPGHAPIVKVLLDAGADIHHKNNKGRDALAIAKDTNDPEILKLLEEKLSQEQMTDKKVK